MFTQRQSNIFQLGIRSENTHWQRKQFHLGGKVLRSRITPALSRAKKFNVKYIAVLLKSLHTRQDYMWFKDSSKQSDLSRNKHIQDEEHCTKITGIFSRLYLSRTVAMENAAELRCSY